MNSSCNVTPGSRRQVIAIARDRGCVAQAEHEALHRAWDHCEPPAAASWEPTETVVKMERGMNLTPRVVRAGVPEGLLFFGLDAKS